LADEKFAAYCAAEQAMEKADGVQKFRFPPFSRHTPTLWVSDNLPSHFLLQAYYWLLAQEQ